MSFSQVGEVSKPAQRKASVACGACKQRKTKCSGAQPCEACSSRGSPCIYDASADQRRKIANQRNLQHLAETRLVLERYRQLIGGIVAIIRVDGDEHVPDLVTTIRSGVDLLQLSAHVRNTLRSDPSIGRAYSQIDFTMGDGDLPSPENAIGDLQFRLDPGLYNSVDHPVDGQVEGSPPNLRKKRHRSGRIADVVNPPISVRAKPWTTVTDDDDFVSHLISLWFTWAHPWWHWVDEEAFLEAMRAGDLDSPNCAPYLVNMILADSCLLDVLDEDGGLANVELRRQFYNEAIKDLTIELQKPATLSTIQTMGVQWTYLVTIGQDKEGHNVLHDQHARLSQLYQWRRSLEGRYTDIYIQKVDRCLDRLTWTIFALDTVSSMSSGELSPPPVPITTRPVPRLPAGNSTHADTTSSEWTPYPEQRLIKAPFHPECHYSLFLSLTEVTGRAESLLPQGQPQGGHSIHGLFYQRYAALEDWALSLPDCVQLGPQSTPHVIAMHAVHHWCMLSMCKEAAAAEADHPRQSNIMGTEGIWQARSIEAARAIGNLMLRMYREWGTDHFPVIITQPVSLALFALLDQLHDEENIHAFSGLCHTARAASRRFVVFKGILRLVQVTAYDQNIVLPKGVERLLVADEISERTEETVGQTGDISVDYLLGKWDDFDLK